MRPEWLRLVTALVCDFDGTIVRASYDFASMRAQALDLAGEYGVAAQVFEGLFTLEGIERAAALLGERGREFRTRAHAALSRYELEGARAARVMPEAMAALGLLAGAGYRVAVVTGNCREALELILGEWERPWHGLLTRDDVPLPKPHPDHALRALAAVGAPAEGALMVGDHALDIETGKRAGLHTVGVLTGAGTTESLADAGADLVVPDLAHLARLLLGESDHACA